MRHVVTFQLERETKGAVRFQEIDAQGNALEQADSVVGSLYLRKTALNGSMPRHLTVTIEDAA